VATDSFRKTRDRDCSATRSCCSVVTDDHTGFRPSDHVALWRRCRGRTACGSAPPAERASCDPRFPAPHEVRTRGAVSGGAVWRVSQSPGDRRYARRRARQIERLWPRVGAVCWEPGDRMKPARLAGRSRKLSDLYIDAKVPRDRRVEARVCHPYNGQHDRVGGASRSRVWRTRIRRTAPRPKCRDFFEVFDFASEPKGPMLVVTSSASPL